MPMLLYNLMDFGTLVPHKYLKVSVFSNLNIDAY